MKREFPLFIVDHNRAHKFGEVDFIYCSDIDNGFIAKVEYIDGIVEEVGEDYRIEPGLSGSNISAKISIKRITGKNPDKTKIRGLLKQAMKYLHRYRHSRQTSAILRFGKWCCSLIR